MKRTLRNNRALWIALIATLIASAMPAPGAPTAAERRAFDAAISAFTDGFFDRADRDLADFSARFPQSELVARAVLLQAQARSKLGDHKGALALLNSRLNTAGSLLDEYRFWVAQAQFDLGDLKTAATGFMTVVGEFPKSQRRLEAAYREALARFKLGETAKAAELLKDPSGAFATSARTQPASEAAVRGLLLLAEALLSQKDHTGALKVLQTLAGRTLTPELAWLRQFWTARAQFEGGDAELARATAAGLPALAASAGSRNLQAEGAILQGNILERLNQPDAAIKALEPNLARDQTPERNRQALLKIVEISVNKLPPTNTVFWLEKFLKEHPSDPSLDVVRLTLAEVKLQQFHAMTNVTDASRSNLLAETRGQLERFLTDFPQSPLLGKAQLNRGLVHWEEGQMPEALNAFRTALNLLPHSEEHAVARFKLADALFSQKDFRGAVSNYQAIIADYNDLPRVREKLFDQALHQTVRASIELGDLDTASGAVAKILAWYPDSFFSDRSLLLMGQALNQRGQPAQARAVFVDFLRRFPESPLTSEVHLAIARTYVQDRDWVAGLGKLDDWLGRNPQHPSRPQAEFDRAWLTAQSGQRTNALARFTNFVARFPTNNLAPLAQNWVADYHFRNGDFPGAEKNYQLLFQNTNWPAGELTYNARLMAGRAAVARQAYKEARDYFAGVFTDEKAPPPLAARALFAWGDAVKEEPAASAARALDKFGEAINAFTRITKNYPSDPLVPAAFGSIGACNFQLATQDPKRYEDALDAYRRALEHPAASPAVRSQAAVGIGLVLERQAALKSGGDPAPLLKQALDQYLDVVYGKALADGEQPEPVWVKEAGLRAISLLESLGRWPEAVRVYDRLMQLQPALRGTLEKRRAQAATQAGLRPK